MAMKGKMSRHTKQISFFLHGNMPNRDLRISCRTMKMSSQCQVCTSSGLFCSFMMNPHFMPTISASLGGNIKTPQQCLMQRGRVPCKWLWIWSVPIMDGFNHLMGRKRHACCLRQGRTEKAILLWKTFLIKQTKPWTYLTNIILMMVHKQHDHSFWAAMAVNWPL